MNKIYIGLIFGGIALLGYSLNNTTEVIQLDTENKKVLKVEIKKTIKC